MSFTITGKLFKKFDTESKSESFSIRDFVLTTDYDAQYPQPVKFQLVNDRTSLVDNANEGDLLSVTFDITGREHDGKFYNNLKAWKVETISKASAPTASITSDSADDEAF